ncbi:MAG: hypothetical protein AAF636_20190 [Pseudomonadota bacterium]
MLRDATTPITGNYAIQNTTACFEEDLLGPFVLGALVACGMRSSLAAVLTFAALATT